MKTIKITLIWNLMKNLQQRLKTTKTKISTIGSRGPLLLQDYILRINEVHFNRERIPERVVHVVVWSFERLP
jgi:catalase